MVVSHRVVVLVSRFDTTMQRVMVLMRSICAASKFMIDTGAGVIDADYRGKVHVLLFNLSDEDYVGESVSLYTAAQRLMGEI